MEGKRIGIVVGGTGAIPEAAIRMAQEHDVELVRASPCLRCQQSWQLLRLSVILVLPSQHLL